MRLHISTVGIATALGAAVVALGACRGGDSGEPTATPGATGFDVVASTTQIADMTRSIAGGKANVTSLVGANQDPHEIELTPKTRRAIADADLVLRNGLGLDAFLDKALSGKRTVTVTDGVPTLQENPHVWMAVANAKRMVENIRDALIAADGPNAELYRVNTADYLKELNGLEGYVRSETDRVPAPCRTLVLEHNSLLYFAAAYDYQIIAVNPSANEDSEPSAADLAKALAVIRAAKVPGIFAEGSADTRLMEQVARDTGKRLVTGLYVDSLGPAGSGADTYVGMMRADTRMIVAALERCQG
ncbi:MAG: metal ABC transporter substrate-binding protein [Dehalococcoidia bacterium]|nr:metal ABC transporter substrate-binding protein [Dehalococcoidia bacterium]